MRARRPVVGFVIPGSGWVVDHSEPHLLDVRGSEVGDTDTVDLVLLPEIGVIAERVSAPGVV